MTLLERRCARLAAAYPHGARRAEVLTTLLDGNAGRTAPRPADVLNVLWHGLAARVRVTAPGDRYGAWGDAASVALVLAVVMHAATASAVVWRGRPIPTTLAGWRRMPEGSYVRFHDRRDIAVAALAAAVAVAAAVAACLGRVRTARALVAVSAAGGLATYAVQRAYGERLTFTSTAGLAVLVVAVVIATAVLLSGAVARAARVVPRWWWPATAAVTLAGAAYALSHWPQSYGDGRAAAVVAAYVTEALFLVLLALPVARARPAAALGAAMVGLPALLVVAVFQDVSRVELGVTAAVAWVLATVVAAHRLRAVE